MYGRLLVYLYGLAHTFVLANLSVIPSQVLLPRTRIYHSPVTDQPLNFNVQVKLKTEHNRCVVWDVQDDGIFDLVDSRTGQSEPEQFSSGQDSCSSSVVVRPVPTRRKELENETSRTFIYGYDLASKSRTSAELSVSGLSFIAFETRNRRISIGQVVTLKVIGYDQDRNTFTSLEGIPFEVKVENSSILSILGLENDPEVSTATRRTILEMPAHFPVSSGYVVCTDVLVLRGVSVGKTKLSLRVLLPEYKHVSIEDVEFIVSEHILVQPHRLLLAPGSSYKFCVSYLESAFEARKGAVDMKNYQWYIDTELNGVKLSKEGLLTVSSECPEALFRVTTKDVRTDETFTSLVSVSNPKSTGVYYSTYSAARAFFDDKFGITTEDEASFLDALAKKMTESCLQGLRTGKLIKGGPGNTPFIYLLKGKKYLFDLSLFDAANSQFTSTGDSNFAWKLDGAVLLWKGEKERTVILKALDEGSINVTVESKVGPAFLFRLNVTSRVTLRGFAENTKARDAAELPSFSYSTRPLVLPLGESLRLFAEGGSGDYTFSVDEATPDEPTLSLDNGLLHTIAYGTSILSVRDVNNEENLFKVQVIVTHLKSVEFGDSTQLHVEKGKQKSVSIRAKGDISEYSPVYGGSWSDADSLYYKFDSLDIFPKLAYNKRYVELYGLQSREFFSKLVVRGVSVGISDVDLSLSVAATPSSLIPAGMNDSTVGRMNGGRMDTMEDEWPSECGSNGNHNDHSDDSMEDHSKGTEKSIHARLSVQVYEPILLQIDPLYRLPKSFSSNTFANVQVGGKVRVVVKGGHPQVSNKANLESGKGNLYVEAVDGAYDIYCLGETEGESVQLVSYGSQPDGHNGQDGSSQDRSGSTREYTISCKVAKNVKIYPVRGFHDAKRHAKLDITDVYFDTPDLANVTTNKDALHVFKAVAFDANGVALTPSHNFTFSWESTTDSSSLHLPEGLTIDNSVCTYKADAPHTLSVHLEWKETYDAKNTSTKFSGLLKAKKVTSLLSEHWQKGQNKRYTHYLADEVSVVPKRPHALHLYTASTHVCVFYNPNVLYRFMVSGGSGNFTEVATSEPIKFSYSPTFTLGVDDVMAPSDVYEKPIVELFDRQMGTLDVAKYVNFTCDYPATKEIDISDKVLLWQKSLNFSLQIAHVSRMTISLHDPKEATDGDAAEKYTLFVGRSYIATVYCFDSSGMEVVGAAPKLMSSNASVSIDPIYEYSPLPRYTVKVNSPGLYNIRAEVENYSGLSVVPNGPVATTTVTVEVYKEVLPLFNAITVLPRSSDLELPFTEYNESLKVSVSSTNVMVTSVVVSGSICKFSTLEPGMSFMEVMVSTGTAGSSSKSKFIIPVHVQLPRAKAEIKTKTQVLTLGYTTLLEVQLDEFTPFYLAMDKKCFYEWSLEGPGHFVSSEGNTLHGPGLTTVLVRGNKEGTLFVSTKVTCDVNGSKFEAVTPKVSLECQKRADPFTDKSACPIIMAEHSIYSSKWNILDVVPASDVMSMISGDILRTGNPGDVLVKSAHGSHHVRVDKVAHVLLDEVKMVKRGGKEDFRVSLKDEFGCPVLVPLDLSLKAFSSNSYVLRVSTMGDVVTVSGVSEGSAFVALQVHAEGRDVVEGFFRVHVKNSIIPQKVSVIKGSNVYHISQDVKRFVVRLNFGVASSRFGVDNHAVAHAKIVEELHKVVQQAGGHMSAEGMNGDQNGSLWSDHMASVETTLDTERTTLSIPLICKYKGTVEEFLHATNEALASLYHEDSILSTLESGLLPQSDENWLSGSPSVYSGGTAKSEGTSVVVLDSDVKGEGHVTVYSEVSKVDFWVVGSPSKTFGPLKHVDLHTLYTIVARVHAPAGLVETTNFVLSNLHCECRFLDDIHSRIFKFVPSQHMVGHNFYPSAHLAFDTSTGWDSFREFLKIADAKVGANLQLKVLIYTTKKRDNLRQLDIPLWSSIFEYKAPQIVRFVDSQGKGLGEVCQDSLGATIYLYPFYGRYSLHSESKHYSLRILERSGLLCVFNIANNGFVEDTKIVVKNGREVIGTLPIRQCSKTTEKPVREIIIERKYRGDLFTISLITLVIYLLYSVMYRHERYYEPTVPIQVERKLPNVFEKIYRGNYDIANGTTHRKLYA